MTPLDIGTDLASSIRWPAHCCGVLGLKPTQHRVSLGGVVPDPRDPPRTIREMSCAGPMARSVDDLALLLRLISGPDAQDTDVAPAALGDMPPLSLRGARIAYSPDLGGLPVSRGVRSVLDAFARSLAAHGAIVETPALPPLEPALQGAGELLGAMMGAMQDQGPSLAEYFARLQRRDDCANTWERFFDRWDLLLCAAGPTTAFAHCASGTPLPADGASIDYQSIGAHGLVFNFTGQPALAMPCGRDADGLPVGAQLVARRWDEMRLLAFAKNIEREIGGFVRPPP